MPSAENQAPGDPERLFRGGVDASGDWGAARAGGGEDHHGAYSRGFWVEVPWEGKESVVQDEGVRQGKGTRDIDRVWREWTLVSDVGILVLALVVLMITMMYLYSGLLLTWDPDAKRVWGSGRF